MDGDVLFSSDQVCRLTGVTYRQLDHWTRTGTISPAIDAQGSGSRRRWTQRHVCAVHVLGQMATMGANHLQLREAWTYLAERPADAWHGIVYADRLGRISEHVVCGWALDLDDARACLPDLVAA